MHSTYTFGNSTCYEVEALHVEPDPHELVQHTLLIERTTINPDAYSNALDDINSSLTVLEDEQTGKHFEIAIANQAADEATVDAEISTFSSSISGNIGNAIECAQHSALHPNRRRIYIASLGNGGSSYWDDKERKYITETGRFTQKDGEPLPTIAALERVLREVGGLTIGRFSTNSAGGAYATALMGALPEGQVTHAYIKSRPNISNHPTRLLWGAGLMVREQFDERRYKANTQDQWQLTDEIIEQAQFYLQDIYAKSGANWSIKGAIAGKGIKQMYSDMLAFSKGGEAYKHPAAKDTAYALTRQPEAKVTYHFPENDALYTNLRKDIAAFLIQTVIFADKNLSSNLEALIMPGTHHDHSAYPSLRWSIEKYALSK